MRCRVSGQKVKSYLEAPESVGIAKLNMTCLPLSLVYSSKRARFPLRAAEERMGCDIVAKSLRAPVRLIASNSGVEGDVIIEKLLGQPFEVGYNAVRVWRSVAPPLGSL